MSNSKYISDYTYLAEASYADFSSVPSDDGSYKKQAVIDALKKDKDEGGIEASESFAELVTQNYTVEAHYQDRADTHPVNSVLSDESGFSSTLFQHKETGEYVLAMRGTRAQKIW